jgi:probable F420-dependent oxidoreductase
MVYGIQLPIQSQSTVYVQDWERAAGPAELAEIARVADDVGLFYVAVCDHIAVPRDRAEAMGTTWYDTIATLGWLAALTTRVRLLSHVWVAAYRHPLASAKAFATLDHLSGGRVIVGVGAGHVAGEFTNLGVAFERRGRLLDEAIDALDVALQQEFPAFAGPTWTFADGGIGPRPVQQPRPPIWVGGSSPAAIRRAAERGDGWLPQGTLLADLPGQIAELRSRRLETGREPVDVGAICLPLIHVGQATWETGPGVLSGPPEKIAHYLAKFRALGVDHLQIRFRVRSAAEQLDQMRAFVSEVAPLVDQ